jgi:hypothetical protein
LSLFANDLVSFVFIDPKRPLGTIPLLFSKQGKRLRQLQKEISLRALADGSVSIHTVLPNGGIAGLANLEITQKIVASPTLLAQFKQDTALSQKALASALAWLKDLRTTQDANAAAAAKVRIFIIFTCSPFKNLTKNRKEMFF